VAFSPVMRSVGIIDHDAHGLPGRIPPVEKWRVF
jgi:hypothetical protein